MSDNPDNQPASSRKPQIAQRPGTPKESHASCHARVKADEDHAGPRSDETNYPESDHQLDARGLQCPEPLMLVRNKIRTMSNGETVLVLATDPTTTRDLNNFCRFMKHQMVSSSAQTAAGSDAVLQYVIRKGGGS